MVANPNFYRGKPAVDEVVFKLYANPDALGQALKKGEIDYADSLEANVFDSLADAPNIERKSAVYPGFNELAFNNGAALDTGKPIGDGNPLLKDKRLREAIGWSLDRKTMVDKVFGGHGSVGTTIIAADVREAGTSSPPNEVSYDPDKAKSLLDAAGYRVGPDGIRRAENGARLDFRLFGRSDSPTSKKAVEYIKRYLADVGIAANVTLISEDALTEKIGQGEFDMFEWGWVVEPDPNYQLSTMTCGSRSYEDGGSVLAGLSDSFYCNPEYDKLFDAQGTETDDAKRIEIVKQMQQIALRRLAVRGDLLLRQPGRLPHRQVRGLHPAARSQRFVPVPVRDVDVREPQAHRSGAGQSSGPSPALIGGIVAAVAVLGGLAFLLLRRRRAGAADDRE